MLKLHNVNDDLSLYLTKFEVDISQVATKCIRVSSTADAKQIIETLIEKFRPDMKMLEVPEYALYEVRRNELSS